MILLLSGILADSNIVAERMALVKSSVTAVESKLVKSADISLTKQSARSFVYGMNNDTCHMNNYHSVSR